MFIGLENAVTAFGRRACLDNTVCIGIVIILENPWQWFKGTVVVPAQRRENDRGTASNRWYCSFIFCNLGIYPLVNDEKYYWWVDITDEDTELPTDKPGIKVSIRTWYPGWLVGWLVRFEFWKSKRGGK